MFNVMLLEGFSIFTFKLQSCDLNENPHGLLFLPSTIQDRALLLPHYQCLSVLHYITVTVLGHQVWFLLLPGLVYCSEEMSCHANILLLRQGFNFI